MNAQAPKLHFQRFEFKYYIPYAFIEPLKAELLKYMQWDPYAEATGENAYEVVSLYYDSPGLIYYHEKQDGMVSRKKIRCRAYASDDTSNTFFEVKRKHDMVVMKDRLTSSGVNLYSAITNKDTSDSLHNELFTELITYNLQPQVIVKYKRAPLVGVYEDRLRVTIDSDIWSAQPEGETLQSDEWLPVLTNGAILEVKYNNSLPAWLSLLIERHDLSRIAYSKYCKGIEKVRRIQPA